MTATIQQLFSGFNYTSSGGAAFGDVVTVNDRICIIAERAGIVATKYGWATNDCLALMPKAAGGGTAIADGKKVYWTGSAITETPTGNTPAGITEAASLDGDTTQLVRLQSIVGVKALTDSSGGTAGTTIGAGAAKRTLLIPIGPASGIADTVSYRTAPAFAFTVLGFRFRTSVPITTANKKTTLTLTTTAGAVTGGVATPDSTAVSNVSGTGASVASTAVSGANAVNQAAGQNIIITASSTTAFVEGTCYIEVDVINLDLANALASLVAK